MMILFEKIRAVPRPQRFRYALIATAALSFLGPLAWLPGLAGGDDLCGPLCMRRFYLYYPGMTLNDLLTHLSVAWVGVVALAVILLTTLFYGRIWCSYLCPAGGVAELGSRMLDDRWKIEYRALPQRPIRYGYFAVFLLVMPLAGISACTLCNFITVPRLVEALSGDYRGLAFIVSSVGLANLWLLLLLGFFAHKGRAYCQFLCPIGAVDGLVNRLGARFRFTHRIRVATDRCSGCNKCARQCMCGAIRMVERAPVVDQYSCMSCHECVDVCDWHAIEWTTGPRHKTPKRVKKQVEIHPEPDWQAIRRVQPAPAATPTAAATPRKGAAAVLVVGAVLLASLGYLVGYAG